MQFFHFEGGLNLAQVAWTCWEVTIVAYFQKQTRRSLGQPTLVDSALIKGGGLHVL